VLRRWECWSIEIIGHKLRSTVFCIPIERNIVIIPDVPYILKLVRNWLLDTGFIKNDNIINKPLEALVSITSTEHI